MPLCSNHWSKIGSMCTMILFNLIQVTITKYQFSSLLNQAWGSMMNPTTICSGFWRCGVYPFKPDAINNSVNITNPGASLQQACVHSEAEIQDVDANGEHKCQCIPSTSLLLNKLALFQRRFSEGYNLLSSTMVVVHNRDHPCFY